jgi:hypothetical protein
MGKKGNPGGNGTASELNYDQPRQRYIHLQRADVAKAFGILQHGCNTDFPAKHGKAVTS